MKKIIAFIVAVCLAASSFADDYLRSTAGFEMVDQQGEIHKFEEYKSVDYLVMFVNGVGCPISRISTIDYLTLSEHFAGENIQFLMFNSNIQDSPERIAKEVAEFKIPFPVLKDTNQAFAIELGVERTADVFVIDTETGQVVYRGPVNDKLGYETQRTSVTHEYLMDALHVILAGGIVNMDNIPESKGCLVGIFN